MEKRKLDALIASTPDNVSYLTEIPQGPMTVAEPEIHAIVFRERSIEPAIILSGVSLDQWAQSRSPVKDVKVYGEFYYYREEPFNISTLSESGKKISEVYFGRPRVRGIVEGVVKAFRERNLIRGRVAFDEKSVSPSRFQKISKKLPRISFVPGNNIFSEIRMVKSHDEVERMREAVKVTEKGIQAVMDAARPGVMNKHLHFVFKTTIMQLDYIPYFAIIAAGADGASPTHFASEYILRDKDMIRMDCGAVCRNYISDICRNAVIGQPTEKIQKYFSALRKGTEAMKQMARPGVRVSQLFKAAVSTIQTSGIHDYKRQLTGHSVGVQLAEPPLVTPTSNVKLQEGMVLAIETPYYEFGFGSLNPEYMIHLTNDGCEKLDLMENKLYVL
jgi:Xaa-Pro dipeptidase